MTDDEYSLLIAHLQAIRTAIVGLALAVITAGFAIDGDSKELVFFLLTIVVCVYALNRA